MQHPPRSRYITPISQLNGAVKPGTLSFCVDGTRGPGHGNAFRADLGLMPASQEYLRAPNDSFRNCIRGGTLKCFKVLDAPGLAHQRSQVMSWSDRGLLIGLGEAIYSYELSTGRTTRVLHGNLVKQVLWASASRFVGIVRQSDGMDSVVLADAVNGHLRNISLGLESTSTFFWEKILAVGTVENTIVLHDLRQRESLIAKLPSPSVSRSISIRDFKAAVGDDLGSVTVFDLRSMNIIRNVKLSADPISAISWRSGRSFVAAGTSISHLQFESINNASLPIAASSCDVRSPVTCLHMSAAQGLLTGHADGLIVRRGADVRPESSFGDPSTPAGVVCIAEDPLSGTLAAGYSNETIRFFKPPASYGFEFVGDLSCDLR